MLLAIDIGNTNIVFAVFDGQVRKGQWRCMTEVARTSDEYLAFLSQHFELKNLSLSDVDDIIISSVVPEANFSFEKMAEEGFSIAPFFVSSKSANLLGLDIQLDRPDEVGADRLVNAIAVKEHYQCPAIVVDFGTATTFDVVNADGAFCGGVIAPGPNLSMTALYMAAAKLPRVNVARPHSPIGKNTVEAMRSGIFWGYVGLTEKIIEKISADLGQKPCIIATGGLATLFRDEIPAIQFLDEELTLKGLLSIYQRLKKQ